MTILCDHKRTINVYGGSYTLTVGENDVPDNVGAWALGCIDGVTAAPKAIEPKAANPETNGETIGRARATRP